MSELTLEFDWSSDYLQLVSAPVFRNGWLYRAAARRDEYPLAPDDEAGPLVLYAGRWGVDLIAGTDPGNVTAALDRWRWSDRFERWLRAFHGAQVHWMQTSGGDAYIAIVTEEMWHAWGNDGPMPPDTAREAASDWQAYLDGDVYFVEVERTCSLCTCEDCAPEWESVNAVGGFYGDEWAKRAALEELESWLPEAKEDDQWGSSAA